MPLHSCEIYMNKLLIDNISFLGNCPGFSNCSKFFFFLQINFTSFKWKHFFLTWYFPLLGFVYLLSLQTHRETGHGARRSLPLFYNITVGVLLSACLGSVTLGTVIACPSGDWRSSQVTVKAADRRKSRHQDAYWIRTGILAIVYGNAKIWKGKLFILTLVDMPVRRHFQ